MIEPDPICEKHYYDDADIFCETYRIHGLLHNINGPAYIEYDRDGNILCKHYKLYGIFHNDNGPAYIVYYKNGNIRDESWWIHGKRHRNGGPAEILYGEDGGTMADTKFTVLNGLLVSSSGEDSQFDQKFEYGPVGGSDLEILKAAVDAELERINE